MDADPDVLMEPKDVPVENLLEEAIKDETLEDKRDEEGAQSPASFREQSPSSSEK